MFQLFHHSPGQQHIPRLDVQVHDPHLMKVGQTACNIGCQLAALLPPQHSACLQQALQGSSFHQLSDLDKPKEESELTWSNIYETTKSARNGSYATICLQIQKQKAAQKNLRSDYVYVYQLLCRGLLKTLQSIQCKKCSRGIKFCRDPRELPLYNFHTTTLIPRGSLKKWQT